jgi:hypothetical protein
MPGNVPHHDKVYLILAPPQPGLPSKETVELKKARNLHEPGPLTCKYLLENRYSDPSIGSGFLEKQEMRVFADNGKPLRDFEYQSDYFLISEKALRLLESIAPKAITAKKADIYLARGSERESVPHYWTCDVVSFVDAVDEEKSGVSWDRSGKFYDGVYGYIYSKKLLGSAAIFRLAKSPVYVFCTGEVKAAVEAAGLTGVRFEEYGGVA